MTLTATTETAYTGTALPAPIARAPATGTWTGVRRVRVWDLPTRLFHWSLVACVAALVATGYVGGAMMEWHARLGYAVLALLMFRLAWGFLGGRWSRFVSFLYSPRAVIDYLRGTPGAVDRPGHNPMGALSVFAMLAVLLVQVGTGLVSDDEISFTGPLSRFVTMAQSLAATSYHRQLGQWAVIGLVLVHVGAIVFYLVRRKTNLVRPMLDGDKRLQGAVAASRDDSGSRTLAAALFAVCAVGVAWLARLG